MIFLHLYNKYLMYYFIGSWNNNQNINQVLQNNRLIQQHREKLKLLVFLIQVNYFSLHNPGLLLQYLSGYLSLLEFNTSRT